MLTSYISRERDSPTAMKTVKKDILKNWVVSYTLFAGSIAHSMCWGMRHLRTYLFSSRGRGRESTGNTAGAGGGGIAVVGALGSCRTRQQQARELFLDKGGQRLQVSLDEAGRSVGRGDRHHQAVRTAVCHAHQLLFEFQEQGLKLGMRRNVFVFDQEHGKFMPQFDIIHSGIGDESSKGFFVVFPRGSQ